MTPSEWSNPARISDPTAPQTLFTDLTSEGFEIEVSGSLNKNLSVVGNYSRAKIRDPGDAPSVALRTTVPRSTRATSGRTVASKAFSPASA